MTLDIHDPRENGRLSPEALLPEEQRWLPFWLLTPLCSTCRLHGERDASQGDKDEEGRNKLSGFWKSPLSSLPLCSFSLPPSLALSNVGWADLSLFYSFALTL